MWRILSLVFLCLGGTVLLADIGSIPLGATIKGFVMPQRNDKGEMQVNITGDTAKAVSVNRTEIEGLKIELYEGTEIGTVVSSPRSELWNTENRLTTQSGVLITRGDMTMSAQCMEWELKDQRAVLSKQVKVVIQKFNFGTPPAEDKKSGN